MKVLLLLLGLAVSITGCTTFNQSSRATDNAPSDSPSVYAKHISHSYLKTALLMIDGSSQHRLSQAYRACVLKPYPAMDKQAQAFLKSHYDDTTIALIDERFLLDSQKERASYADQAWIEQKIDDNKQQFAKLGINVMPITNIMYVLLDKETATQAKQIPAFNAFHRLTNQRLAECTSIK